MCDTQYSNDKTFFKRLEKLWNDTNKNIVIPSILNSDENILKIKCDEDVFNILKQEYYNNKLVKGFYLNELWLCELTPSKNINTNILIEFILNNDESKFKELIGENEEVDWWNIMNNLSEAFDEIFKSPLLLSKELIYKIHNIIGKNNVFNENVTGKFRTWDVEPSQSSTIYCKFNRIDSKISQLIEFVNNRLEEVKDIYSLICLGGIFFSEFLLIHPFGDGNGRVARLLLAHILRKYILVPVSLYLYSDRGLYINILETRKSMSSNNVIGYVYLCVLNTLNIVNEKIIKNNLYNI